MKWKIILGLGVLLLVSVVLRSCVEQQRRLRTVDVNIEGEIRQDQVANLVVTTYPSISGDGVLSISFTPDNPDIEGDVGVFLTNNGEVEHFYLEFPTKRGKKEIFKIPFRINTQRSGFFYIYAMVFSKTNGDQYDEERKFGYILINMTPDGGTPYTPGEKIDATLPPLEVTVVP